MESDSTKKDIILKHSAELEKSITGFNAPLATFLKELSLPVDNILYPISERKKVINALQDALEVLPIPERQKAFYLTKFTVAIAVGLFDGALNYLWNETIQAIRTLVLSFDLEYFYSIAEKVSSRNKSLSTQEDIEQIADHDLLESARRIGLLSDVNYKRLEYVNYMRNHVSAAHPSEDEVDGFEVLSWLSVCLKHAITAKPDHSTVSVKRLLENIRNQVIPSSDVSIIIGEIAKLPQERIDDLSWTLFGMYTDTKLVAQARTNIQGLCKGIWDCSSEDRKYEIGAKYGIFRKNADVPRKDLAQEFLAIVGGLQYKDEDSLAGELIEKLDNLKTVHFSWYNFYNEHPHARALADSLPPTGLVPRAARTHWVKVISICAIGNGLGYRQGVDERAIPYYNQYITNFTEAEVIDFLHLFNDPEFTSAFDLTKPDERLRKLADFLKGKSTNVLIQKGLDLISKGPKNKLDKIASTTDFKNVLQQLPKRP